MQKRDLFAHIPVRFLDGTWVGDHDLPVVAKPGTRAHLVVAAADLANHEGLEPIFETTRRPFLAEGDTLLIALSGVDEGELKPRLFARLKTPKVMWANVAWEYVKGRNSTESHFFPVVLGKASRDQIESLHGFGGGLLVTLEGDELSKIEPSELSLPEDVSTRRPMSLNHLYTILSEVYETRRASHTGSIYQRIFYQETDDRWYPLEYLRSGCKSGTAEGGHARAFWGLVG